MASAAGGTSQRLNFGPAIVRSFARKSKIAIFYTLSIDRFIKMI